jgi:hypothetical protein
MFGDSDILPVPFEYEAMQRHWSALLPKLASIDVASHETRALQPFMVPKPDGGYRVATRLDPIDAIIYTALVYEAGPKIEASRIPANRKIACSYRIEPRANGTLFRKDNGWDDWYEVSDGYCKSDTISHVLVTDISDFYSQISHHRVANALEAAGLSSRRAGSIERLLTNWGALQSQGIPTGPQASVVLSEACLNDVDMMLLRAGYDYARYADDYRIFCRTRVQAQRALHDLSQYLHTAHRLSLQPNKTRIYETQTFFDHKLNNPGFQERQRKTEKVTSYLDKFREVFGYVIDDVVNVSEDDLSSAKHHSIDLEVLVELFDECVKEKPLRLGLARYLLRRARIAHTRIILPQTLESLPVLVPVLGDAMKYVAAVKNSESAPQILKALHGLLEGDLGFLPFVRLWVLQILTTVMAAEVSDSYLTQLATVVRPDLGERPMADVARATHQLDWVRHRKEIWKNAGPWDRRAIIRATSILSRDELGHWKRLVEGQGVDDLDRAVATLAIEENRANARASSKPPSPPTAPVLGGNPVRPVQPKPRPG